MDDLISRQAAIDALSTPHGILYPIRTIENIPSAQPEPDTRLYSDGFDNDRSAEPCEDVVSRQAAIDAFWSLDAELRPSVIDAILQMLNGLPSAQPSFSRDQENDHSAEVGKKVEQPEPCEDAITVDWLTNYMNGMIVGSDRWWGVKWMLEDWAKSRENKNHDT